MKTAVIFYSLSGNTETAAKEVAKVLNADVFGIETIESGFFSVIKQLVFRKLPEIEELKFSAADYDKIVLAAPCWANNVAPAMKSFLKKNDLKNKEIALLLCHGGGVKNDKIFDKWKTLFDSSNKIVAHKKMINPKKFQPVRSLSVVGGWAEDIWEQVQQ